MTPYGELEYFPGKNILYKRPYPPCFITTFVDNCELISLDAQCVKGDIFTYDNNWRIFKNGHLFIDLRKTDNLPHDGRCQLIITSYNGDFKIFLDGGNFIYDCQTCRFVFGSNFKVHNGIIVSINDNELKLFDEVFKIVCEPAWGIFITKTPTNYTIKNDNEFNKLDLYVNVIRELENKTAKRTKPALHL
jgi:hypothetical protein